MKSDADRIANCGNHDEHTDAYCKAWSILQIHADRMAAAEYKAQVEPHLKKGCKKHFIGRGCKWRYTPSAALQTACKMMGDGDMTPEKALAFIHDPAVAAWETDRRMRNTG
jgi:hypothetical protein